MHKKICVDGEVVENAQLPALSAAALYGRGVFTTVSITGGEPFLWERHWHRLTGNAAAVGLAAGEPEEGSVRKWLSEVIRENAVRDAVARVTLFDAGPTAMWSKAARRHTSVFIATRDRRPVPPRFRLTLSPYRVNSASPLAGVKSCNYLENIIAGDEARGRGFDEAVRLNERGEVASGTMSNIFWLVEGKLRTPALTSGCLAGTTREFILENTDCEEVSAGLEELQHADAIFLTSAGLGVAAVDAFDGRPLGAKDHPILNLIPK